MKPKWKVAGADEGQPLELYDFAKFLAQRQRQDSRLHSPRPVKGATCRWSQVLGRGSWVLGPGSPYCSLWRWWWCQTWFRANYNSFFSCQSRTQVQRPLAGWIKGDPALELSAFCNYFCARATVHGSGTSLRNLFLQCDKFRVSGCESLPGAARPLSEFNI